jgi:hypothetical protein
MTMDQAFMEILGHRYVSGMPNDDKFRAMYEAGRLFGIRQGRQAEREKATELLIEGLKRGLEDDDE